MCGMALILNVFKGIPSFVRIQYVVDVHASRNVDVSTYLDSNGWRTRNTKAESMFNSMRKYLNGTNRYYSLSKLEKKGYFC